jgi:hypothetical protein
MQTGCGVMLVGIGRCQNDQMPIMKSTGRAVLAPSSIPAKDGKYHELPGNPVRTLLTPQRLR